jgi:hypothetical protein
MPKQTTHIRVVREWLTSLGILAAVSLPREEAQMRLAAFVPMLLDRFPDAAFTPASLEHVAARAVKGFPTYGELVAWLGEWWKDNRPAPVALPPPDIPPPRSPPTEDEIAYVRERVQEIVANLRVVTLTAASVGRPLDPTPRPGPRYLSPRLLDEINPLPNGRKRADVSWETAAAAPERNAHPPATPAPDAPATC